MKIKELKHNHSLTDLLKVLLFSILMLAPIFAIGVKCGYVVINKNAKDSYSGAKTMSYDEITNYNDIKIGNRYQFNNQLGIYSSSSTTNSGKIFYSNVENIQTDSSYFASELAQGNNFRFYYNTAGISFYIFNNDTTINSHSLNNNQLLSFTFIIEGYTSELQNNYSFLRYLNSNNYNYIDNVFYYAIEEIEQEPLFNWTQNTAVYTGVNAMCTGMEITSPIIPILITYWFLLTCIYVIIDILIKGFTMLTHIIGSKMA